MMVTEPSEEETIGEVLIIGEVQRGVGGRELWRGREKGVLAEQPGNWQIRGGSGLRKLSAQSFLEVGAVLGSLQGTSRTPRLGKPMC